MPTTRAEGDVSTTMVDDVPVIWVEPAVRRPQAPLALWLPALTLTKESFLPFLRQFAQNGYVAVSLDPWRHGERGLEAGEQLAARVFGDFRRQMWPILGHTTLDCLRVIDWAIATLDTSIEVVAGGVSMGGDIAVALAGIDTRVTRVASIVATPDWTRPGMCDLTDPSRVLPQGRADALAQWFYDHLDPMTHPDAYARGPAIAFECAADDTHVPPDGALRFQTALREAHPAVAERIRVTLHPGLGHLDGARNQALAESSLAWLLGGS